MEKKSIELKNLCSSFSHKEFITLREMAGLLGNFNWTTQAVAFAQAHLRGLQALYKSNIKQSRGYYSSDVEEMV